MGSDRSVHSFESYSLRSKDGKKIPSRENGEWQNAPFIWKCDIPKNDSIYIRLTFRSTGSVIASRMIPPISNLISTFKLSIGLFSSPTVPKVTPSGYNATADCPSNSHCPTITITVPMGPDLYNSSLEALPNAWRDPCSLSARRKHHFQIVGSDTKYSTLYYFHNVLLVICFLRHSTLFYIPRTGINLVLFGTSDVVDPWIYCDVVSLFLYDVHCTSI